MFDIRRIKENPDEVKALLWAKEMDCDAVIDRILELDVEVRSLKTATETKTAEKNKLSKENIHYKGISLSRNRGHQNALLAGLSVAKEKADVTVSMDADLQDDIMVIKDMVDKYHEGFDIVYGVRSKRETDSFLKRNTALAFYKFMNFMGAKTVYNHADYRLMSKKALEALSEYEEVNLFLRGIIPDIGLKHSVVHFDVFPRMQGESKYSLSKALLPAQYNRSPDTEINKLCFPLYLRCKN